MNSRVTQIKTTQASSRPWRKRLTMGFLFCIGIAAWYVHSQGSYITRIGTLPGTEAFGLAFSPAGDILAVGGDNKVKLWDVRTRSLLRTFATKNVQVLSLTFSPDGHILATTLGDDDDPSVQLWAVDTGRQLHVLPGHRKAVRAIAFSPDGQWLATGSADSTIRLWSTQTGKLLRTLKGHRDQVVAVAFAPDGKVLASAGEDGTIRLWDGATGKLTWTISNRSSLIQAIAFPSDGRGLETVSADGEIRLWDPATGEMKTGEDLQGRVGDSVIVSRNGNAVAWGERNGGLTDSGAATLYVHEHGADKIRFTVPGDQVAYFLALSPDGKILAVSDSSKVALWNVQWNHK